MNKNPKIGSRERKILDAISNSGTVALTVLFDQLANFLHIRNQSQFDWKVKRSISTLENKGLIQKTKGGGKIELQLTDYGRQIFDENKLSKVSLVKPEIWDGIWRIVSFDIPEGKRAIRGRFRAKLKELGFLQIQKSVFCNPWPCTQEILELAKILNIVDHVQIMEGSFLTNLEKLKIHFRLISGNIVI